MQLVTHQMKSYISGTKTWTHAEFPISFKICGHYYLYLLHLRENVTTPFFYLKSVSCYWSLLSELIILIRPNSCDPFHVLAFILVRMWTANRSMPLMSFRTSDIFHNIRLIFLFGALNFKTIRARLAGRTREAGYIV